MTMNILCSCSPDTTHNQLLNLRTHQQIFQTLVSELNLVGQGDGGGI